MQHVSISPDLGHAIVFVSPLGDTHDIEQSVAALQRASMYVRRQLAKRIRVYRIPQIRFQLDPQMLTAAPTTQRSAYGDATDREMQTLAAQPDDGP